MSDSVQLLTNPDARYWTELVEHAVRHEGWCNATDEYQTWRQHFGDDFQLIVAVDKETQELAGTVSVTHYNGATASDQGLSMIGVYFVVPKARGKGIGSMLFEEALRRCKENKFLFGAATMAVKYTNTYKFANLPEWRVVKRTATVNRLRPLLMNHDPTLELKTPAAVGWNHVMQYMKRYIRTLNVEPLMKSLLAPKSSHALVAVTAENRIVAIGAVRENFNGVLFIGPLIGSDAIAASSVLRGILTDLDNLFEFKEVVMFCPTVNEESSDMVRQLTEGHYVEDRDSILTPQFTGSILPLPVQHIYGIGQDDVSLL